MDEKKPLGKPMPGQAFAEPTHPIVEPPKSDVEPPKPNVDLPKPPPVPPKPAIEPPVETPESKAKKAKEEKENKERAEAKRTAKELTLARIQAILREHNNLESEIPISNEYWMLVNQYRSM